jgi:hypothetical protein
MSLHIRTAEKIRPRGFAVREEDSQNLVKRYFSNQAEKFLINFLPLRYFIDVVAVRLLARRPQDRENDSLPHEVQYLAHRRRLFLLIALLVIFSSILRSTLYNYFRVLSGRFL